MCIRDRSRVYPIARGTAPLLVALIAPLFIGDKLSLQEYIGVTTLGFGILLMAQGIFANGENRKMLPFALGSALATATYTLIDGTGARVSGSAAAYVAWVFVADGCFFTLGMLALRGWDVIPRNWHAWRMGTLATAQWFAVVCMCVSFVVLFSRQRKWHWRDQPIDSMVYMQGIAPAPVAEPV